LNAEWLTQATLVPIPPSKVKTDPNYDDRMVQVCRGIRAPAPTDVRELIEQIASTDTFKGGHRKSPAELRQNYRIAENQLPNLRGIVGIFDDVLTTGSHFKAVKQMILERAPHARVIGLFVARRAIPCPLDEVTEDGLCLRQHEQTGRRQRAHQGVRQPGRGRKMVQGERPRRRGVRI
jgi:hypothetical protein